MRKIFNLFILLTTLQNLSAQLIDPVVMLKGKVLNERNMKPIAATIIYETLPEGEEEGFAMSNPIDGSFSIILKDGKKYSCYAVADGYYSVSSSYEIFDLKKYKEIDEQVFYLAPIEQDQVITLNSVKFKSGTDEILVESHPELNRFVEFLKVNKKMIVEIGSHCYTNNSPEENLKLSEQRAKALTEYLVEHEIKEKQIQYKGYGQTRPITFNKGKEGIEKNERIECIIKSI